MQLVLLRACADMRLSGSRSGVGGSNFFSKAHTPESCQRVESSHCCVETCGSVTWLRQDSRPQRSRPRYRSTPTSRRWSDPRFVQELACCDDQVWVPQSAPIYHYLSRTVCCCSRTACCRSRAFCLARNLHGRRRRRRWRRQQRRWWLWQSLYPSSRPGQRRRRSHLHSPGH